MISSTIAVKSTILAAAVAAALTVAGCTDIASNTSTSAPMPGMDHGGSAAPAAPSAVRTDFDDADVMFLQMMYPHHAQAVDMAKLVQGRSQNQQVIALAQNIESAQGPEMTQMTGLLTSFGKPAPSASMSGHDMPGMGGMPGMMSATQMDDLKGLSGTVFDQMWLQMMIDHHGGAIDMSNTELRDGTNSDAKEMAKAIIANQQAEITQMRSMLGQG
jgi:uncharacterized protein (DUF305 family)